MLSFVGDLCVPGPHAATVGSAAKGSNDSRFPEKSYMSASAGRDHARRGTLKGLDALSLLPCRKVGSELLDPPILKDNLEL